MSYHSRAYVGGSWLSSSASKSGGSSRSLYPVPSGAWERGMPASCDGMTWGGWFGPRLSAEVRIGDRLSMGE